MFEFKNSNRLPSIHHPRHIWLSMNRHLIHDESDEESPIIQRKRRAIVLDSDDEADFVQPPVRNDVCNENVNSGNDAKQPGHVIEKAFIGLSISSSASAQSNSIDLVDDITQRKLDFNAAVRQGKQHEANSNWVAALQSYQAAARLFPERNDLNKKLSTLQTKVDLQNAIETAKPIDEWFRGCAGVDEVFMSFIQPESAFDHQSAEPASASALATSTFRMPLETHSALYQYQRRCLHWLWSLHCGGDGCGGILGDDMGLGKTVQISAFLCGLFHSKLIHSVLLVAPVSVLSGWERELGKWCEGVAVRSFHGTSAKSRNDALDTIRRQGGVLLTSYGLISTSADVLHQAMAASPLGKFDYVILDEGHRIKNPSIQLSKRMREIAAAHRVVVTGTPMSNSLDELWYAHLLLVLILSCNHSINLFLLYFSGRCLISRVPGNCWAHIATLRINSKSRLCRVKTSMPPMSSEQRGKYCPGDYNS
jgi:hypothetical protein